MGFKGFLKKPRSSSGLKLVAALYSIFLIYCGGAATEPSKTPSVAATTGSTSGTGYEDAKSTKVIFNKQSFYNNYSPSSYGCPGDAKIFYDTLNDRAAPTKPTWLKNISIDLTNVNSANGSSNATTCGLFGGGASEPANCAVFDDLQSNAAVTDRPVNAMLFSGCAGGPGTCATDTTSGMQAQLWTLNYNDVSTSATWSQQTPGIPALTGASYSGLLWSAGDYDEIHDRYYLFGGTYAQNAGATSMGFSNSLVKFEFDSTGIISSSALPAQLVNGTDVSATHAAVGGWHKTNLFSVPPTGGTGLVGHTFTYSSRRHGALKTWCTDGDTNSAAGCPDKGAATTTNPNFKTFYEDQDYFLLTGGMTSTGAFQSGLWVFTPHGFSSDVATHALTGGSWNDVGGALATTIRGTDHKISVNSAFSPPFIAGSTAPYSVSTAVWASRAYHRVSYDPGMNRFYIFGGLKGSFSSASATNELWIYDPPATGRRPTGTCYVSTTPDSRIKMPGDSAFTGSGLLTGLMDDVGEANYNLSINKNYLTDKFAFPPGGCLQQVDYPTTAVPSARFEQAQAFDREQRALLLFGGCKTPSAATIAIAGATTGDPTTNCNSSNTLLGDTWIYLPPTTTEVYDKDTSLAAFHPYATTSSIRLANIFGTDYWLDHLPIYSDGGFKDYKTYPRADEVLGTWIQLSPTDSPTKRVSPSVYYDRNKHKFYLFGGQGCTDTVCSSISTLNDFWEFTPPDVSSACNRESATCYAQGTWKKIKDNAPTAADQPRPRKGAQFAFTQPQFASGDQFYTVTDTSCYNEGPILTGDSSVSKQYVGAIYIDIDRDYFSTAENLLINLRFLPFDSNTKLAAWFDNGTTSATSDDRDYASGQDQAVIRVQLLNSYLKTMEEIQTLPQPRFHNFLSGTPVIADQFVYVSGGSGQVTEKQILVPLTVSDSIDLIKIERIQGSVKFYEMSVSKF